MVLKNKNNMISFIKIVVFFILTGLCEIGGCYLVWIWLKEKKSIWYGIVGAIILAFYGYVMTLQMPTFGKSYVDYGGVFTVMVFNDYS